MDVETVVTLSPKVAREAYEAAVAEELAAFGAQQTFALAAASVSKELRDSRMELLDNADQGIDISPARFKAALARAESQKEGESVTQSRCDAAMEAVSRARVALDDAHLDYLRAAVRGH